MHILVHLIIPLGKGPGLLFYHCHSLFTVKNWASVFNPLITKLSC